MEHRQFRHELLAEREAHPGWLLVLPPQQRLEVGVTFLSVPMSQFSYVVAVIGGFGVVFWSQSFLVQLCCGVISGSVDAFVVVCSKYYSN